MNSHSRIKPIRDTGLIDEGELVMGGGSVPIVAMTAARHRADEKLRRAVKEWARTTNDNLLRSRTKLLAAVEAHDKATKGKP